MKFLTFNIFHNALQPTNICSYFATFAIAISPIFLQKNFKYLLRVPHKVNTF